MTWPSRPMRPGKIITIVCHATCIPLKARLPFRIEDKARNLPDTNFMVQGQFRPHTVRHGLLITGQQQYSGTAAARLVIEALGQ